jgi:hypothetical protein
VSWMVFYKMSALLCQSEIQDSHHCSAKHSFNIEENEKYKFLRNLKFD